MSTLKDLTEAGRAIGLEGTELHTFIKDEQARERQERLEAREVEKDKLEVEREEREAQRQADRDKLELVKLDRMAEEKERDRQLEKDRLDVELAKEKVTMSIECRNYSQSRQWRWLKLKKGLQMVGIVQYLSIEGLRVLSYLVSMKRKIVLMRICIDSSVMQSCKSGIEIHGAFS